MQLFKFPMEYLRVTQKALSTYSHAGSLAMDFGGKDTGSDKIYCPCDMIVKRVRLNANGEIYLESTEPVLFADGKTDYARLILIHGDNRHLKEGQVLKLGEYVTAEGGWGSGNPNAFAKHIHIEGGKGKWSSTSQHQNSQGTWVIENQSKLEDMFILGQDVVILDGQGYDWKVEKKELDPTPTPAPEDFKFGVDLSKHQTTQAAQQILSSGKADYFILRATIGSESVDENFNTYINTLKGKTNIGFYQANYCYNEQDAIDEANYMIDTIEKYGIKLKDLALPLFFDWEYFSKEYNDGLGRYVTWDMLRKMADAWINTVESRGGTAGLYFNRDIRDNWYGTSYIDGLKNVWIWLADPDNPDIPQGECDIHQYEVSDGSDFGYSGNLDKNKLYRTYIELDPTLDPEIEELEKQIAELEKKNEDLEKEINSCLTTINEIESENEDLRISINEIIEIGKTTLER